jgi:hypothetical protein
MSQQLTLSIPHRLSEAEVKTRLTGAIADARQKHPTILAGAQETWSGNRMDFRITMLGQLITGDVVIEPNVAHLHVNLPWMLQLLAQQIRPQIEAEARKLLDSPKQ